MGKAARAWILEHYVEARVVGMTVDYYKSLLDARAGHRVATSA